jgi:hypothetical protein
VRQGIGVYSPGLRKHQSIEEFLTTKANKAQKEGIKRCFMPLCAPFAPLWLVFLENSCEFKEILTIKK